MTSMMDMRECIAQLGPEDMKPSYSLAKLAIEAEVKGVKRFRCQTIHDNGWCLGAECRLYPRRGFGGGAPITNLAGFVSPTIQIDSSNTRGRAVLGLDDPSLDPEVKDHWEKLLNTQVRDPDEHDGDIGVST